MNYYQITFNNLSGFNPNRVHDVITKTLRVPDWWHYLPNSYIVETAATSKYIADKIIQQLPGLNFIITKIDIYDYNGYLNKRAWQWIEKKLKSRGVKYVPHTPSPLVDLLSGHKPKPSIPVDIDNALDAMDKILGKKK